MPHFDVHIDQLARLRQPIRWRTKIQHDLPLFIRPQVQGLPVGIRHTLCEQALPLFTEGQQTARRGGIQHQLQGLCRRAQIAHLQGQRRAAPLQQHQARAKTQLHGHTIGTHHGQAITQHHPASLHGQGRRQARKTLHLLLFQTGAGAETRLGHMQRVRTLRQRIKIARHLRRLHARRHHHGKGVLNRVGRIAHFELQLDRNLGRGRIVQRKTHGRTPVGRAQRANRGRLDRQRVRPVIVARHHKIQGLRGAGTDVGEHEFHDRQQCALAPFVIAHQVLLVQDLRAEGECQQGGCGTDVAQGAAGLDRQHGVLSQVLHLHPDVDNIALLHMAQETRGKPRREHTPVRPPGITRQHRRQLQFADIQPQNPALNRQLHLVPCTLHAFIGKTRLSRRHQNLVNARLHQRHPALKPSPGLLHTPRHRDHDRRRHHRRCTLQLRPQEYLHILRGRRVQTHSHAEGHPLPQARPLRRQRCQHFDHRILVARNLQRRHGRRRIRGHHRQTHRSAILRQTVRHRQHPHFRGDPPAQTEINRVHLHTHLPQNQLRHRGTPHVHRQHLGAQQVLGTHLQNRRLPLRQKSQRCTTHRGHQTRTQDHRTPHRECLRVPQTRTRLIARPGHSRLIIRKTRRLNAHRKITRRHRLELPRRPALSPQHFQGQQPRRRVHRQAHRRRRIPVQLHRRRHRIPQPNLIRTQAQAQGIVVARNHQLHARRRHILRIRFQPQHQPLRILRNPIRHGPQVHLPAATRHRVAVQPQGHGNPRQIRRKRTGVHQGELHLQLVARQQVLRRYRQGRRLTLRHDRAIQHRTQEHRQNRRQHLHLHRHHAQIRPQLVFRLRPLKPGLPQGHGPGARQRQTQIQAALSPLRGNRKCRCAHLRRQHLLRTQYQRQRRRRQRTPRQTRRNRETRPHPHRITAGNQGVQLIPVARNHDTAHPIGGIRCTGRDHRRLPRLAQVVAHHLHIHRPAGIRTGEHKRIRIQHQVRIMRGCHRQAHVQSLAVQQHRTQLQGHRRALGRRRQHRAQRQHRPGHHLRRHRTRQQQQYLLALGIRRGGEDRRRHFQAPVPDNRQPRSKVHHPAHAVRRHGENRIHRRLTGPGRRHRPLHLPRQLRIEPQLRLETRVHPQLRRHLDTLQGVIIERYLHGRRRQHSTPMPGTDRLRLPGLRQVVISHRHRHRGPHPPRAMQVFHQPQGVGGQFQLRRIRQLHLLL